MLEMPFQAKTFDLYLCGAHAASSSEGILSSALLCVYPCHVNSFPSQASTTLSDCIDGVLSTEYIDDFTCARCRLQHALETYSRKLKAATSDSHKKELASIISKLQQTIETNPEKAPGG